MASRVKSHGGCAFNVAAFPRYGTCMAEDIINGSSVEKFKSVLKIYLPKVVFTDK